MFRFLELSLHGWDLWPAVRVPLHRDVILVTGPNGSGKTTLLDSVRQLLNAPKLSSRRRLQHYLRHPERPALLRAVVSNEAGERAQPFARERILTPEATIGCALVPGSGGTPEKRFIVLAGRATAAELQERLLESREWYGAERYGRVLESAGVTRSLMGVLAIEQGRTNSLFEIKAKDLFLRVLDMLGDRAVLERYRDARRRYDETRRELLHQLTALASLQTELEKKHREVRRLDEFEQAQKKVVDLEATVPAAVLQVDLRRKEDVGPKVAELRTKVSRGEAEQSRLKVEVTAAESNEQVQKAWVDDFTKRERTADEAKTAAIRAETVVSEEVKRLEKDAAELAALPEGDLAATEREERDAQRLVVEREREQQELSAEIAALDQRIAALAAGQPVYPEPVEQTLRALRDRGIETELLAARCEVVGEDLGAAAEAALGDARFALVVAADAAPAAADIAMRHQFPGPLWSGPTLTATATVGPLSVAAGAPTWVPDWLGAVELSADGTWRDARGLWVGGPEGRVIGERARELELARCREHRGTLTARRPEMDDALSAAQVKLANLRTTREQLERRAKLLSELEALPSARSRHQAAAAALQEAKSSYEETKRLAGLAKDKHREAAVALTKARSDFETFVGKYEGEKRSLELQSQELAEIDARLAEAVTTISQELIARAHRGELDGPGTVRRDLDKARAYLGSLGEPPPETLREEARHLESNVEELEGHVASRQKEVNSAEKELAECRERYLEIVSGALRDYRARVQSIAEMADLAVEMRLPTLGTDDRSLDEATIDVSIGFDGKDLLPLGDPSFSGGQQVIAGLVLLMGMAEVDGHGFFMLDEPFAHLSLDRVDQVGRFLRATKSQFILTAPTTLDRAQLDPASLLIALRKMRPGETAAPGPIVSEA